MWLSQLDIHFRCEERQLLSKGKSLVIPYLSVDLGLDVHTVRVCLLLIISVLVSITPALARHWVHGRLLALFWPPQSSALYRIQYEYGKTNLKSSIWRQTQFKKEDVSAVLMSTREPSDVLCFSWMKSWNFSIIPCIIFHCTLLQALQIQQSV